VQSSLLLLRAPGPPSGATAHGPLAFRDPPGLAPSCGPCTRT